MMEMDETTVNLEIEMSKHNPIKRTEEKGIPTRERETRAEVRRRSAIHVE